MYLPPRRLQPGQDKKDAERQLAIEATCAAHLAAAAAAAAAPAGQAEAAAKAAFDAAFQRAKEEAAGKGAPGKATAAAATGEGDTEPADAGGSAASLLRQRLKAVGGGSRQDAAQAEAAGQVLEQQERRPDEDEDVPEWMRGGFTWKVGAGWDWMDRHCLLWSMLAVNTCSLGAALLCAVASASSN